MTSSSLPSNDLTSIVDSILSSADPNNNSYDCFDLKIKLYEPSMIRRTFYKLSLQVHPDKNSHPQSKEAFQKLSTAFEILYDLEHQKQHLQQILQEKRSAAATSASTDNSSSKNRETKERQDEGTKSSSTGSSPQKKRKTKHDWKEEREKKKKKQQKGNTSNWSERRWEDVLKELRRREDLERSFIKTKSDERMEKRIKGMIWKAMKVCRNLDERAGCPPSFVNGLWAPLYEQEVFQTNKRLPEGWEYGWDHTIEQQPKRIYRYIPTGEESFQHPVPDVEILLEKARNALEMNKFHFYLEPRLFLDEIIEYLKEDHDYEDMDDDMKELEEEEQAKLMSSTVGNNNHSTTNQKEYDY